MTIARAVALAALAAAIAVVALILLRSGETHTYQVIFQNAGQLVKDDDVQVGGRRIGSVTDISLTRNNQAKVTIAVDGDYAPLRDGTTALIRQTSLSGVANRYVTLTMAPDNAPALPDGATIGAERTTTPVDLDQLLNMLDPQTRRHLQQVIRGSATQYRDKGEQANAAAEYLDPALSTTRALVNELTRDQQSLSDFIRTGAGVTNALAQRSGDLTDLVTNANRTAAAIGAERAALSSDLRRLPPTLRRANTTFVNLRSTLDDLTTLVDASKPATKDLAPFLRALRPLVRDARPTIADLRTLIRRPGAGNDLIDLLEQTPQLEQAARPAFASTTQALRKSVPVLSFVRPYAPELTGWLRDFGQGAANYDANGHYARIQPMFTPFSFADNPAGGLLLPQSPVSRLTGVSTGNVARCPGAASQPTQDGSAPWRDSDGKLDCDPSLVLPGP
jgi:phospholipid/cholesterol/gamma-HCH transport system substrate-binding protein